MKPESRANSKTEEEIISMLKSPKKNSTRRTIKFFLKKLQNSVVAREQTKSYLIAFIHEIRKGYRYLAKKMQQNGLLPDPELIFYFTHDELGQFIKNNRIELLQKAQRRTRLFPEWKKNRFDEFIYGVAKPLEATKNIDPNAVQVHGTAVCEGSVTGVARVVKNFSETSRIKAGDILITHSTDIAWSPYFPILGGVVTELGGLISHGAVVAREHGLPCIVGATNATDIFKDGDLVTMDATHGVIYKCNE